MAHQTFTLTYGDQAENHVGMQKVGEAASEGFSFEDLQRATCVLATLPLHYQWFYRGKPVGARGEILLNHWDIYNYVREGHRKRKNHIYFKTRGGCTEIKMPKCVYCEKAFRKGKAEWRNRSYDDLPTKPVVININYTYVQTMVQFNYNTSHPQVAQAIETTKQMTAGARKIHFCNSYWFLRNKN